MRPAFDSTRQAAAFALLLAALLALPVLLAHTGWLKRNDVYPAIPWKYGPFPWIQQQIFEKTNDVDIAFVGSSLIWCDVNTPYVQKALSEKLGRDAEVFTLGWPWPGFDADYIIARDLLQHRRVKLLVVYNETRENPAEEKPHLNSSRWLRVGENPEVLEGLPLAARLGVYGGAVLGTPRNVLTLIRPNLTESPAHYRTNIWDTLYHAENFARERGALRAHLGFNNKANFSSFAAPVSASPADTAVYSLDGTNNHIFSFRGRMAPYQSRFVHQLAELCQKSGTRLVFLHLPELPESDRGTIFEDHCWTDFLPGNPPIVGIPGARLFAEVSTNDLPKFYYNKSHLNANGQDRFTPLITPALLELYATKPD